MLRVVPVALLFVSTAAAARAPVQVTRFVAGPTIVPGSAAPASAASPSLEQHANEDAVGRQLSRLGFSSGGGATDVRYTYTVDVNRETREPVARHSPVSIGVGGGTGGYGSGGGLGLSFGLGGRHTATVVTRLSVQMRDTATRSVVWEGRATTTTSDRTQPSETVDRLADALFKGFPGDSGRTITVR